MYVRIASVTRFCFIKISGVARLQKCYVVIKILSCLYPENAFSFFFSRELEALKFAEEYLSPCILEERHKGTQGEAAITPRIEQCMCLLAFENPEESMFKELLSDYHRLQVAELLNCYLLQDCMSLPTPNLVTATPHPMPTALSWLVQAMIYAEDRCGDSIPHLESLESGRLKSPAQAVSSAGETEKDA